MSIQTMSVNIARLGAPTQDYTLAAGATASAAMDAAGMPGATVRVNDRAANGDTALVNGDRVLLIPRVQGGCR